MSGRGTAGSYAPVAEAHLVEVPAQVLVVDATADVAPLRGLDGALEPRPRLVVPTGVRVAEADLVEPEAQTIVVNAAVGVGLLLGLDGALEPR